MKKTLQYSVGIDEVGRGPLAGPVAVGVVRTELPRAKYKKLLKGIRDSKKASASEREEWATKAKAWRQSGKIVFAVTFVSAKIIDAIGIVPAIQKALVGGLKKTQAKSTDVLLLDGGLHAPKLFIDQTTIIKGDDKEPLIALAATVAKVARDAYMTRLAKKYPKYGFELHKGYGTKVHRMAIKKYGASLEHRKSFLKNFDKDLI